MISMKPARVFQVFAVGDNVVAHGLKAAPELNGKAGRITAFVKDRATVQFDHGDSVNIKPVNLKSIATPAASATPAGHPLAPRGLEAAGWVTRSLPTRVMT